jgi:hypothetical protein
VRWSVEFHVGDGDPEAPGDFSRHVRRDPLRIAGRAFSRHQEPIAHIDSGAKNPRRGELGYDLAHDLILSKNPYTEMV